MKYPAGPDFPMVWFFEIFIFFTTSPCRYLVLPLKLIVGRATAASRFILEDPVLDRWPPTYSTFSPDNPQSYRLRRCAADISKEQEWLSRSKKRKGRGKEDWAPAKLAAARYNHATRHTNSPSFVFERFSGAVGTSHVETTGPRGFPGIPLIKLQTPYWVIQR